MSCQDCLQNCPDIISDGCVQYTGPDVPLLGICQGDTLSQFEADIVAALTSALDGTGIQLTNVTLENCPWLLAQIGTVNPKLNSLLQLLINSTCTLKSMIDAINAQIESPVTFNVDCLSGVTPSSTRDEIIQAIILLLCDINDVIISLPTTYVKLTDLNSLVTAIVNNIISGGGQQNSKMVPYVAYEYYGPLSNFDGSGIGISALGYNKVYICNGSNGTPDKRGRVTVGAIRNVPGGPSLDPAVDPSNPNNPNWAVLDKFGENMHTLTIAEIPSHTHPVTDSGHTHAIFGQSGGDNNDNSNTQRFSGGDKGVSESGFFFTNTTACQTATTGISIGSSGGGQPHNNIQPSISANYIMYIP